MERLLKLLVLLLLGDACWSLGFCKSDQICISEQRCNETDDSGSGIFGPRILGRSCGAGLVCCDKAQLESYEASMATRRSKQMPTGMPIDVDAKLDYKSCDVRSLCVPRHLCRTGTVNEDGRFILKPRIDNASNSGCGIFESCCPIGDQLDEKDNPVRRQLNDFKYKGCGYSNPTGLYYALVGYNDHEARFAEFPWMVAVMDLQGKYICGATLIHPQLVLTSAHNVAELGADELLARAGEYDLNSNEEPYAFQSRRISNLWRHEQFNSLNFHNDIAMLVLEQPFQLAPHVQPLCLPAAESTALQKDLREAECFATGWGHRNFSAPRMEHILKRIDLPVLEHEYCQRLLRRTVLGRRFKLDSSFLCAGGVEGKDTCKGDGGSPLFCSMAGQNKRYQLAGIVSWGIECADKDIPAAYTSVPHLRSWIDEQASKINIKLEEP
ncbi:PREDICTED: vitellin-degrading protease [Drosophila arizonae]|uniref:Vitellin-degrading protease n=1 Tax=Drosophila arizonae TaxID=7263 RepID=A0ABM1PH70_DROAR|nr:PREDICTED: vitellin-degrading protease [Drosophila arizonae]